MKAALNFCRTLKNQLRTILGTCIASVQGSIKMPGKALGFVLGCVGQ
jgi:hypothetical protein